MIKFRTESGSIYEADPASKRWRKQGETWRAYEAATEIAVGLRVVFAYASVLTGAPEHLVTSLVVEVL